MQKDLVSRVGPRAARRLFAFAERARAVSPLPVLPVVLFGSRARGDAVRGSDWDVAVVVDAGSSGAGSSGDARTARRSALSAFADLAFPDIAAGFHLRPIVVPATEGRPDPVAWQISPELARNISTDGLRIA
jgi:hypothetical protein